MSLPWSCPLSLAIISIGIEGPAGLRFRFPWNAALSTLTRLSVRHPNEPEDFQELSLVLTHSECLSKGEEMNSQTPSRLPLHSTEYSNRYVLQPFHCLAKTKGQTQNGTKRNWRARAGSDEETQSCAPGLRSEFSERACFPCPWTEGCPPG